MKLLLGSRLAIAAVMAVSAVGITAPAYAAGNSLKQLTRVAPGQTRYLIEYNAGNKQAIKNAIASYGGRVVYDYSALFNGLAADLSDQGVKSLRTSGLAKTIQGDVIRTLHGKAERLAGEDLARSPVARGETLTRTQAPASSRTEISASATASPIRATSSVSSNSQSTSPFDDGGATDATPSALPAGFPDGAVFSEFVGWDRDRVNSDVVWSTGPNFGVPDNNIATPNVAPGSITGAGVVVGVLDTGIDYDHPDLQANIMNDCGSGVIRDFLDIPGGLDDCAEDNTFNGHGTSVASVIASVDNTVGLIGNAPGATIRPYRVCDGGCPLSAIIGGLVQATADGVDVINMSFGGGAGFNIEASAVQAANAAGIVLVGSAGNDASQKVHFPAGYDTVIAVGATNGPGAVLDQPASFTNTGGWVDVTGPGVNNPTATCTGCVTEGFVDELTPDVASFAANELTNSPIAIVMNTEVVNFGRACNVTAGDTAGADPTGKVALMQRGTCSFAEKVAFAEASGAVATVISNNAAGNFFGTLGTYIPAGPAVSISQADGAALAADIASATTTADVGIRRRNDLEYWLISGTSFSGPTVAGVAALVLEANPNLSPIQVRNIIESTAEPIGPQVIFGKGMVRTDNAVNAALP